jgi:hypothetical protein
MEQQEQQEVVAPKGATIKNAEEQENTRAVPRFNLMITNPPWQILTVHTCSGRNRQVAANEDTNAVPIEENKLKF